MKMLFYSSCSVLVCFFILAVTCYIFSYIFSATLNTPEDGEILIDFSKNRINEEVFALLVDLASCLLIRFYLHLPIFIS